MLGSNVIGGGYYGGTYNGYYNPYLMQNQQYANMQNYYASLEKQQKIQDSTHKSVEKILGINQKASMPNQISEEDIKKQNKEITMFNTVRNNTDVSDVTDSMDAYIVNLEQYDYSKVIQANFMYNYSAIKKQEESRYKNINSMQDFLEQSGTIMNDMLFDPNAKNSYTKKIGDARNVAAYKNLLTMHSNSTGYASNIPSVYSQNMNMGISTDDLEIQLPIMSTNELINTQENIRKGHFVDYVCSYS